MDVADVLDRYPVSAHWQRILLGRLDAVGSIYRPAAAIADVAGSWEAVDTLSLMPRLRLCVEQALDTQSGRA